MEKSINKRLDIAAIRAAQKNVVSIPSWVESGKLAYSRQHQCHVRVLDCLGELANVEIKGKIQQIPIIELEEASFSSTTIDNSSISHSVFKAFASDFIGSCVFSVLN